MKFFSRLDLKGRNMMKNKNKVCAIVTCPNPNGIKYFLFPKDIDRQKVWIQKCNRSEPISVKHAQICGQHFSEDCFSERPEG